MPKGLQGFQKGHGKFKGSEKGEFKKGVRNNIKGEFKKGHISIWTADMKEKNRQKKLGEKNPMWKGDKVGYNGIHTWVHRNLGQPKICQNKKCIYPRVDGNGNIMKHPKGYDWANISKKYKRELTDWVRLCKSCHQLWDRGLIKIKINDKTI